MIKQTKQKARSLHYMIELRRRGFNRKLGRTFIVHYDEESVMEHGELRKLIHYLANTSKQLSEGPIITTRGHTSYIRAVAWSPDGHFIASGSEDGTVQLW